MIDFRCFKHQLDLHKNIEHPCHKRGLSQAKTHAQLAKFWGPEPIGPVEVNARALPLLPPTFSPVPSLPFSHSGVLLGS
jgi:hypothetical protein